MALHLLRCVVGMNVIPKLSSGRFLCLTTTMNNKSNSKSNCDSKPQPPLEEAKQSNENIIGPDVVVLPFIKRNYFHASPFARGSFCINELKDVIECARYAIDLHNENENAKLKFVRMLNAGYETVAGKAIYIMLEAADDAGILGTYLAIVWWRSWMEEQKQDKIVKHFGPVTW